ncbi:MAG: succinate dehydrogenase, cytochrome b556 subunit [Gammaproteobacteria bacterium]|nr:succinate dehydrogenase, cytochrome b556 subunit [Gammaproteobacteria bacterium]
MRPDTAPLSPHLQVYRFPLTVILSITHRVTGAVLALGALLLLYVLFAAVSGEQSYQSAHALVSSGWGQSLLFLWTFALYFHFCNGIRHLVWDVGYGLDHQVLDKSAWIVLIVSTGLTLLTWLVALTIGGGA